MGDSLPDTFHSRDQKPGFSVDEMSFHASGSLKSSDPPVQTAKNLVSLPKVSGKMGGTDPDGNKDENVFDIRQGVAMVMLIIKAEVIAMGERQAANIDAILTEAERRLRSLSPERLRVANDFLAYLQEREENQATAELLSFPGFEAAFRRAVEQADSGDVVRFKDIRRDGRTRPLH